MRIPQTSLSLTSFKTGCIAIEKAPDKPTYVTIGFEQGVPVSVDGKKMDPRPLVEKLNELGGKNGIGIADIVEDRLVGMKSRGVYETPGGTILYAAIQELEFLCLDRDTQAFKRQAAIKFAELVYDGKWYTPLREALSAMVDSMEETVTGEVKLKLYKGCVTPPELNLHIHCIMRILQVSETVMNFTAIRTAKDL